MNVLLTGHAGFLGHYIADELNRQQHRVLRLGRTQGDIICNLSDTVPTLPPDQPVEVLVHVAGKAHTTPKTPEERQDFFTVNLTGTQHLLEAAGRQSVMPKLVVFVSTVAVYGQNVGEAIGEDTPLNADSPYGLSKIAAEEAVKAWCRQHGCRYLILRPPLIVGDDAPGNLLAMRRGIERGYYVRFGAGVARRSMVRADDVAQLVARFPEVEGTFNLTDGQHPSVRDLEDAMAAQLGKTVRAVPMGVARFGATIGDLVNPLLGGRFPLTTPTLQKLTQSLTFDDSLARRELGWQSRPVLDFFR